MEEALIKRILPHSIEAEQSVIGSMLHGPVMRSSWHQKSLPATIFIRTSMVSSLMRWWSCVMKASRLILITLQNRLKEKDVPPDISSMEYVRELLEAVPTSANVKYYANIVSDKAHTP